MVPWVRENSEVNPKLISGPMIQKSCPRIGIPVPSWTKPAARHSCWMKIGVCVICRYPVEAPQSRSAPESTRPKLSRRAPIVESMRPILLSVIIRDWEAVYNTTVVAPQLILNYCVNSNGMVYCHNDNLRWHARTEFGSGMLYKVSDFTQGTRKRTCFTDVLQCRPCHRNTAIKMRLKS